MNPVDQSRRSGCWPISGRGSPLLWSAVLLGLAGCADALGTRQQGDPLVGIHAPPAPMPVNGTGNGPVQAAGGQTPALPASHTAPGPAAMASGETSTSEEDRRLAITTDTVTPVGRPSGGTARGSPPGVTLSSPEPASTDSTSHRTPAPSPAPSPLQQIGASAKGSTAITSVEEAQQFLNQHGVTWQRFIMEDKQWQFDCGIPNRDNPAFDRHYKTDRPYPDQLSAMRAVIAAIEQKAN